MADVFLTFAAQDDGTLSSQFGKVAKNLGSLEASVGKTTAFISKSFGAIGAAVALGGLARLVGGAFDYAESIKVAGEKTGIAVDQIQRLQFIAEQADVSFDSVTSSINKFQKNLVEESAATGGALKKLGLDIGDLRLQSSDEQFIRLATAISEVRNPAEQTALAMQLFGRGGTELLPFLKAGPEGIRQLSASFDELGITISGDALTKLNEAGDAVDRLTSSVKNLGVELLSVAATPIEKASDGITLFIKSVRFLIKGGDNEIVNLSQKIEELRARSQSFYRDFTQSGQHRFHELRREADRLETQLNRLLGLGTEGAKFVNPTVKPDIDFSAFKIPDSVTKAINAAQPRVPTAQETREDGLKDREFSRVNLATLEADQLQKINQDKLDKLLDQEFKHSAASKQIDGDLARFKASVRETFGLQEITFEAAKNASILDIGSSLFGALAKENSKVAKAQQALAIVTVTYDTAQAIMKAYRELPYPANIGASLKAAALGAIQIAKIKATNYGGGSGGGASFSAGSGGSSAAASSQPAADSATPEREPQRVTQVFINGVVTRDVVTQLMDGLKDEFKRGAVVITTGTNQAEAIRRGS